MIDKRVIAFIPTPIKAGDLFALLSGEASWEMSLEINEDGTLVVTT